MTWEQGATITCNKRGLNVLGFEGGYVFVADENGKVFPIGEEIVATWMKK